MRERPILFIGPMVRALLDGRKTQTRRIVKPQGWDAIEPSEKYPGEFVPWKDGEACNSLVCPYGVPGDLLWVREAWAGYQEKVSDGRRSVLAPIVAYRATDERDYLPGMKWKPSIHMPRWASRITLRVTDVRVERVQDISLRDVRAEGCEVREFWLFGADAAERQRIGARVYGALWEDINGRASWDANPWVWAVTFEQVRA